ncbi:MULTISPECIES: acetyl-CoA carboxylase [Actinomycetaceae]|uniref:Acetyl-CoA carboxylase n=2 Tax=Actinomycetaceae TaxID=2049 RepID=A0ABZ0RDC9_9ACTO|nr:MULTISPECIES: acetyl-CoA carboxylase [Actinotignum]MDK8342491.1 acetyl-CoA carboxylase [Winkia sp. UMB3164B]MDK8609332.1 acetyl-CoA carboxylase [Actinomycetaceae bacterium UMB8041A]WPJ89015.1 acetyl-CoA carboxylase [Schaalia turicensis]MDE1553431.1 acetyl-CoA carboxylase [Actinotignum sanguinis]MDE1566504.1 acetyl-CoA carboxylase [Actinotignum sanguinis]
MTTEEENTELTESVDDSNPDEDEVQLPIVPVKSDATPAPPTEPIKAQTLPAAQVASIDLTVPILEVLTDPTM